MSKFTKPELETFAMALDCLVRQQKDVLLAAKELLPLRDKIEQAMDEIGLNERAKAGKPELE